MSHESQEDKAERGAALQRGITPGGHPLDSKFVVQFVGHAVINYPLYLPSFFTCSPCLPQKDR